MNARAVLLLGGHGDGEIVTIPYDRQQLERSVLGENGFEVESYYIRVVTDQYSGKPYHVGLLRDDNDIIQRLMKCYHDTKMEEKARAAKGPAPRHESVL
jgi:hypothetical protein